MADGKNYSPHEIIDAYATHLKHSDKIELPRWIYGGSKNRWIYSGSKNKW